MSGLGVVRLSTAEQILKWAPKVFQCAREHGWWDDCEFPPQEGLTPADAATRALDVDRVAVLSASKMFLIITELAEAFEEYRLPEKDRGGALGVILYNVPQAEGRCTRENIEANGEDPKQFKPEGFVVEIADAVIRALDLCAAFGDEGQLAYFAKMPVNEAPFGATTFESFDMGAAFMELSRGICKALPESGWRPGTITMARFILACEALCKHIDGDLWRAVEVKHAYNETRSYRHGNKTV